MTDVVSTVQVLLQEAGYDTWLTSIAQQVAVCFEDADILGFANVFPDVDSLLGRWHECETAFLREHAPSLRVAADKAWNVYCIFLTPANGDATQQRRVRWIAEDLERTRKLAACGLLTRDDIGLALLPLLPIQHRPTLLDIDVTQRLKARIAAIAPLATDSALDSTIPIPDVVLTLGTQR